MRVTEATKVALQVRRAALRDGYKRNELYATHESPWTRLVLRYAGKRHICNCGQAYTSNVGITYIPSISLDIPNMPACQYGCEANRHAVKDYIAAQVFAELEAKDERKTP